MPNMTVEQARQNLFETASTLTIDQMPEIFGALKKVLDEMTGDFLWPAVKTAHQAYGIQQEDFANNLFIEEGMSGKPLLRKTSKWDYSADPYTQLDLKVWCRYLHSGGKRILDKNDPKKRARDQLAFFDLIHMPRYPHQKYVDFVERLEMIQSARDIIEHEYNAAASLKMLMDLLYALTDVLADMNYVTWNEKRDLWKKRLLRAFFNAIGVIDYSVAAVIEYMEAEGCTVSAQEQPALEKLMKDAGMSVKDGKMSFSGNIIEWITNDLADAWEMTGKNRWTGIARLKKAVRGSLPPYAQLTQEQKRDAIDLLEKYTRRLKKPLVDAVKEAHQAAEITAQTFQFNLYITKGTGEWKNGAYTNDAPLLAMNGSTDPDPYQRLDLHGWLKYLRFGGCRLDSSGNPVKDQDAVFDFLGIPYGYTSADPRVLDCEIAEHLAHLNDARNEIISHWTADTVRKTTTQEIMQWREALLALLEPMSWKHWQGKDICQKLMEDLKADFNAALGGLTYSVADILEYLKPFEYAQPEVEARLTELGFRVSGGCVTVEEDIEDFLAALPVAMPLMRDMRRLPESPEADKKLAKWIMDRARAYDERAVRWFEKRAYGPNPIPAALYYLGCCGLFHRATQLDRHESVAMLRCAAKKGDTLAQIRMGQYHEGWYRDLWSNQNAWQLRQDNGNLRSDGPESGPDWRDHTKEQNRKTANPAEAFAWYQKAADKEDPQGLYHLGRCYRDGIGTQYYAEQAYQCFWEAAQQENLPAQYALALCYDGETPGIDVNRKKAWAFYEALIEKNYTPAMKTLGQRYATLPGRQRDLLKAVQLLSQAGSQGDAAAYMELAHWFLDGKLVAPSDEEGFKWLKRAAKAGDAEGLRVLGECCQFGIGVEKDAQQADALLRKAAAAGDEPARWEVGNCLADGIGNREDMFGAVLHYFEKVKELDPVVKGICESQKYTLGFHFSVLSDDPQPYQPAIDLLLPLVRNDPSTDGDVTVSKGQDQQLFGDTTEDPEFLLYRMGCRFDKGIETAAERLALCRNNLFNRVEAARMRMTRAIACHELAECYERGEDTAAEAIVWYTEAAEQGLRKAMRAMGRCYAQGIGVAADVRQAVQWYHRAVEAGDAKSMSVLADCYLQNWACLPEVPDAQTARNMAVDLYLRAYRLGNWEAHDRLNAMGVEIDEDIKGSFAMDCLRADKLPILEEV